MNDRMVKYLMQMDLSAMLPFGMNLDYVGNYQVSNYYNLKYLLLLSSLYLSFEVVYSVMAVLMEGCGCMGWVPWRCLLWVAWEKGFSGGLWRDLGVALGRCLPRSVIPVV